MGVLDRFRGHFRSCFALHRRQHSQRRLHVCSEHLQRCPATSSKFPFRVLIHFNLCSETEISHVELQCFETETTRAVGISVFIVGIAATLMAIRIKFIYDLWLISVELVYIVLFPLLFSVFYVDSVNRFGSICGFVSGLLFLSCHLAAGDSKIGLPPLIPGLDNVFDIIVQYFPLKTCFMLMNFTIVSEIFLQNEFNSLIKSIKVIFCFVSQIVISSVVSRCIAMWLN